MKKMFIPSSFDQLKAYMKSLLLSLFPSNARLTSDHYVRSLPSVQNAVDLFKGDWWSKLPLPNIVAGEVPLFEDSRIQWAIKTMQGLDGKKILEVGPLEGGHSYMMEAAGASSITAIEMNRACYLRCLITKEILSLKKVNFLCGDILPYLRSKPGNYDVVFALGVLYHMINPVEFIELVSGVSDKIVLWTHYYEKKSIESDPKLRRHFSTLTKSNWKGYEHTLCRQDYFSSIFESRFCGGTANYSNWILRDDLIGALKFFGFTKIEIGFDAAVGPAGPNICVLASKE
ncbi:MAG TPA: class I SAM-dependent methyltransferase [Oligoflexus sp.]|uniref:class I SAM-dependent methyltransferase n=1 Tax=Oligoflexus sp. TaxID=1971216 RepID=UPI002D38E0AB|nr:class I SAM-dependent methyltransferase [Oligoflexus sp.]HYX32312.1 class I SAM-dependent methyltransferase [Oligoflexus sp.]